MILEWLSKQHELVQALARVLCAVVPILLLVPGFIWWERRLLSWMQDRIGPNRTGTFPKNFKIKALAGRHTFGLLQPIADGVKLFFKEDITPKMIDGLIYFIAPGIALFPAFAIGLTMPWGPVDGPLRILQPVADVSIGILWVLAISSLGVYGVVLAGYSSNNKYSLMGGLRASAQLISYELAMGMAVASIVLASGSLRMTEMVRVQQGPLWGVFPAVQNWFIFTPYGLIAAFIFAICIVAETNRPPFDLPEAENELIAGYHTEYSSMKFAVFFMGEYAAMFIFSGVFAVLFLGGFNMVPVNWLALGDNGFTQFMNSMNYWLSFLWFLGKCFAGLTVFIWLRATLPRLRYDQLMNLGWKSLLPLGVANFIVVALWILATEKFQNAAMGWGAWALAMAILVIGYFTISSTTKSKSPAMDRRGIELTDDATPNLDRQVGVTH